MRVDLICTDPEQWTIVPPSNGSDEVIDRYLAHVDNCPFHAALEQNETDDLQRIIEAARSLSPNGLLPLAMDEESKVAENLERYIDFRNGKKKITIVRLRGIGLDDKVLDVSNRKERVSFNVPAPCALQVLATVEDGSQDLLIATHVINPIRHKKVGPISSQLHLSSNQSLNFETRPLGGNWFQVAVSAGKLHWIPMLEKLRFNSLWSWPGKPITRTRMIGIAQAALVVALSISLLALFFTSRRTKTFTDSRSDGSDQAVGKIDSTEVKPVDIRENEPNYVVKLNDGSQVLGLDSNGKVLGLSDKISVRNRRLIEAALQTRRIAINPLPQTLQSKSADRMGATIEPSSFFLFQPVQKIIATTRPSFIWQSLPGAESYNVKLFDDNYNLVTESGPITDNSWELPPGKELVPGRTYVWKVVAIKEGTQISSNVPASSSGQRLTEAKFKVLERAKAREINEVKKANGSSHLLLGILYARAGMHQEAELEFVRLLKANPQSKVAQEMLNSVRSARR